MRKYKISQIPVVDVNGFVGSVDESDLFQSYITDKNTAERPIREVMGKPFPIVKLGTPVEEVSKLITKENQAVLIDLGNGKHHIITEGIGEDILPKNVDFSLIDGFTKVTDKDAAVYTRKIALEEGIFVGNSAGAAVKGLLQLKEHFGPEDVVVVLFHDSGSRYVGKMFNDDWMRERGFLEEEITKAEDLIKEHIDKPLVIVRTEELVSHAIERMRKYKISQIPVVDVNGFVGSVDESDLFQSFISDKNTAERPIREVMGKPFPIVKIGTPVEDVSKLITKDNQAVLVDLGNGKHHIITKYDIIGSIK